MIITVLFFRITLDSLNILVEFSMPHEEKLRPLLRMEAAHSAHIYVIVNGSNKLKLTCYCRAVVANV